MLGSIRRNARLYMMDDAIRARSIEFTLGCPCRCHSHVTWPTKISSRGGARIVRCRNNNALSASAELAESQGEQRLKLPSLTEFVPRPRGGWSYFGVSVNKVCHPPRSLLFGGLTVYRMQHRTGRGFLNLSTFRNRKVCLRDRLLAGNGDGLGLMDRRLQPQWRSGSGGKQSGTTKNASGIRNLNHLISSLSATVCNRPTRPRLRPAGLRIFAAGKK